MKHVYNDSSLRRGDAATDASPTRRNVLKTIAAAVAGIGAARLGWTGEGNDLPHLTDRNPAAASLGYTEDSSKVDPREFPRHKPEQRCANCKYFEVAAISGGPYAPCRLYPGNAVNVNGWCSGYVAKA